MPKGALSALEMHPTPDLSSGNLTEFNDTVDYMCPRGMKFADDIHREKLQAICRTENEWEEPDWRKCVESELKY